MTTMYTMDQACKELHVSRNTLLRYIRTGQLKAAKVGGKWQIPEDSLAELTQAADPEQAREDDALLDAYHRLTPSRRAMVLDLARDLQDVPASLRIQRLTPREQTFLGDYRHLAEHRRGKAEECLRDLVRKQDDQEQYHLIWGAASEDLQRWAMAAADQDPSQAGYLLSMLEDEVNRQLPMGQWFDVKTCRPMVASKDRLQDEDAGTSPEDWTAIMTQAEDQALLRLRKWQQRQQRLGKGGESYD